MNNLSDLTFIIPIRQDCLERLENVIIVTKFLIKNFSTNIKVLECASYDPYTDTCSFYDSTTGRTETIGGTDMNKLYDDYWRSGANGADESAVRTDTPLFEWLWKQIFGSN